MVNASQRGWWRTVFSVHAEKRVSMSVGLIGKE